MRVRGRRVNRFAGRHVTVDLPDRLSGPDPNGAPLLRRCVTLVRRYRSAGAGKLLMRIRLARNGQQWRGGESQQRSPSGRLRLGSVRLPQVAS